ncbi:exopolyphosphatase [Oceanimonas sp. CHS3-5]|uniref:Ppx/GppA phosphatase family protein n=1 Tax=Oceanimonas sp. CHS3-5 TaxID=3068186 RepID=UPI00273ED7F3|nr:exopolyphosphatase [Oceanimonas sp. CHS3-5]MDP5291673.1 exopolyphosphatase [Oceanimonas sp. CHS3-5]
MTMEYVASIDLGSNSFHLIVARRLEERLITVDRIKQRVRLADGLNARHELDEAAMARGLDCLALFGERLRGFSPAQVRAVATYTLRRAVNAGDFVARARQVLGFDIDIISGEDEARLIYRGARTTQARQGRALVIDIGGGSTELIIGEQDDCLALTSLDMGCVSFTHAFFADGSLTEHAFTRAEAAALALLNTGCGRFAELGWQQVLGCSGTVRTLQNLMNNVDLLTLKGLLQLRTTLLAAGRAERLSLPGLSDERKPVIAAGLAILIALFRALNIERMHYTEGALREGLLHSAFGPGVSDKALRRHTLQALGRQYRLDHAQANRVAGTAQGLFKQVRQAWQLSAAEGTLLVQAARLHELGVYVNVSGYHRHSAWLIANGNLPGFTQAQQQALSSLVRFHRKGLKLAELTTGSWLPEATLWRLVRLLRLAVALNRYRRDLSLPVTLSACAETLALHLPARWCEQHRLLHATLERECSYQSKAGWTLLLKVE